MQFVELIAINIYWTVETARLNWTPSILGSNIVGDTPGSYTWSLQSFQTTIHRDQLETKLVLPAEQRPKTHPTWLEHREYFRKRQQCLQQYILWQPPVPRELPLTKLGEHSDFPHQYCRGKQGVLKVVG